MKTLTMRPLIFLKIVQRNNELCPLMQHVHNFNYFQNFLLCLRGERSSDCQFRAALLPGPSKTVSYLQVIEGFSRIRQILFHFTLCNTDGQDFSQKVSIHKFLQIPFLSRQSFQFFFNIHMYIAIYIIYFDLPINCIVCICDL